jgi:hypothetical protein
MSRHESIWRRLAAIFSDSQVRQLLRVIGPEKVDIIKVMFDDCILLRQLLAPNKLAFALQSPLTDLHSSLQPPSVPSISPGFADIGQKILSPAESIILQWIADLAIVPSVRALWLDPSFVSSFVSIKLAEWYMRFIFVELTQIF